MGLRKARNMNYVLLMKVGIMKLEILITSIGKWCLPKLYGVCGLGKMPLYSGTRSTWRMICIRLLSLPPENLKIQVKSSVCQICVAGK